MPLHLTSRHNADKGHNGVSMEIEINLRLPAVKDPSNDEAGARINNLDVRFTRRMKTETLPKAGELVDLTTRPDHAFQAKVTRADWHEGKSMFIVSCKYAKPSIPRPQFLALMADQDWTMKRLLK